MKSIAVLLLSALFVINVARANSADQTYPNEHLLITAFELNQQLNVDNQLIIDMRPDGFEDGHIPGSVWFGGSPALVDGDVEIASFLIDSEDFQELMQSIGLNNESSVIIYDDGNSLNSARLFFALELNGFGNARILNGGFQAWQALGFEESNEAREVTTGNFSTDIIVERTCDVSFIIDVLNSDTRDDFVILDARTAEEHIGEREFSDRSGRIPGAVNIEWIKFMESEGIPFFRSFDEITAMLAEQGITPDKEVITHCQSNVRGSHAYFTLRLMGYDSVRAYEGSWEEWGNRSDTLIES